MEFPQSDFLVPILVIALAGAYIGYEWWRKRRDGKGGDGKGNEGELPDGDTGDKVGSSSL